MEPEPVHKNSCVFKYKEEMKMSKEAQVKQMTDIMAKFVGYTAKVLPDDVAAKLKELTEKETVPIAKLLYETYAKTRSWPRN